MREFCLRVAPDYRVGVAFRQPEILLCGTALRFDNFDKGILVEEDREVFVVEVEGGEEFFARPGVPVAEDEEVFAEFEGVEEGFGVVTEGAGCFFSGELLCLGC